MIEDMIELGLERAQSSIIKVVGVGGAGCNAVNHMYNSGIHGVDFIICNTDAQAMLNSPVPVKIQLGATLTGGRGAGNQPEQGEQAAIENLDDVRSVLEDTTKMMFITAGMGGGTGTGAAPVIAALARELGILTIAVVTVPSPSEGRRRYEQAKAGVDRLQQYVDSILVVSNEKLHLIHGNLPASQAFKKADDIITTAVKGIAEIITVHGNINIDFADVYTVMANSNVFIMGTGIAEGDDRAMTAVHAALESPLLDSNDINGTKDILLNIISGEDEITMGEIGDIIEFLQNKAGQDANIIWGNGCDPKLGTKISVTIAATRFDRNPSHLLQKEAPVSKLSLQADMDPEAGFDEPIYQGTVFEPVPEPSKSPAAASKTSRPVNRKKKASGELIENSEAGDTDNWFKRQFMKLFEEQDDAMTDKN
ncbi:MAG: cell division protein FtsZ [Mangrovibacterium sp.]